MSTIRRIAKNTAVLFAAHIGIALLGLLLSIIIARKLGDVTFGKYSFTVAFIALFAVLPLGFDTLLARNVARDKSLAPKYLGNLVIIKAILSLVIFGLIALIINLMDYPHDTTIAVLIFGIYVVFTALANTFKMAFQAYERMELTALVTIARQLLIVSLGLAAIFLGYGLITIASIFAIASMLDLILSFSICGKKLAKPKIEIDIDFWKKAARVALPLTFVPLAAIIYTRVDMVMLSAMKGDAVVGWYGAAYSLVLALQFIPTVFLTALSPLMAQFFVSSQDSLKAVYEKSIRYLFIIGLPIAAGATLLAHRVIPLFFGSQFADSITALQILAWDILLFFLYRPLLYVLFNMDKEKQLAAVAGACAVMNVLLNLALIPSLSYVGAGIATIATETILLGAYFYLVSKYLYRLPMRKTVAKPLIACAIMAVFVYFCSGINLAALIVSAAVLYFVMLYLLKEFSQEDIDLLKQAIRIPKFGAFPFER